MVKRSPSATTAEVCFPSCLSVRRQLGIARRDATMPAVTALAPRTLLIANRPVSTRELTELAAHPQHADLEELTLFNVGLDDEGAVVLAAHCRFRALRALALPWNRLTARGLAALLRAPAL